MVTVVSHHDSQGTVTVTVTVTVRVTARSPPPIQLEYTGLAVHVGGPKSYTGPGGGRGCQPALCHGAR
jgi:hypothetical protein